MGANASKKNLDFRYLPACKFKAKHFSSCFFAHMPQRSHIKDRYTFVIHAKMFTNSWAEHVNNGHRKGTSNSRNFFHINNFNKKVNSMATQYKRIQAGTPSSCIVCIEIHFSLSADTCDKFPADPKSVSFLFIFILYHAPIFLMGVRERFGASTLQQESGIELN